MDDFSKFFPLENDKRYNEPQMRDLFGTWPGESVVLKTHGPDKAQKDWIYILSNQSKIGKIPSEDRRSIHDDDKADSCYQCYRITLVNMEIID